MKQLLRLLWDPTTHELMILVGIVGAVLNVLLPGATGGYREVLTAALAALASFGGISDAVVQHSANNAAATAAVANANAAAAASNAQEAAHASNAAAAANQLLGGLGGMLAPPPAGVAPSDSAVTTGAAGAPPPPATAAGTGAA